MATWHQTKARTRNGLKLYDRIKWNVVTDPPGGQCSIMQFADQVSAQEYLFRLRSVGKDAHTFILPPATK